MRLLLLLLPAARSLFAPRPRAAPRTRAAAAKTLFDKIWDDHLVTEEDDTGAALIYIDRHLVHEVTSPQAFEGLRLPGRPRRGARPPPRAVGSPER
mmetsp:Transcript_4347/g.12854  ORF Transcript_4347/g.12854 Transcript_4347/m.12854 type:complete len:96 (-) Transcript_4347:2-289(-)